MASFQQEGRIRYGAHRKKQIPGRHVVNALGVLLAPFPEILVKICEGSDFRHGDEGVAAAVAHLVLHIDWSKANAKKPSDDEQHEYWQFRINKSKGRVVGMLISGVFYVVWLDPHHNLTNSEGYGREQYFKPALSLYEKQDLAIADLQKENSQLKDELKAAEELLNEKCI